MIKFENRRKPDKVYKVKQIFSAQNLPCFWVNVTNRHGEMKTLGAGREEFYLGIPVGKNAKQFEKLALPKGTYLTKVECFIVSSYGIDQAGNLWHWGQRHSKAE